jgi:putative DNA primase/helicase
MWGRRMSEAANIAKRYPRARQLGDGNWQIPCPLPSHGKGRGDLYPSLTIKDGDRGLLVNCKAGCDPIEILRYFRDQGDLPERKRLPQDLRPSLTREPEHTPDPIAVEAWRIAVTRGEVLQTYLKRRGINVPPPATLRQGVALQFGRIPTPCMVAAVQEPHGPLVAVQTTLLTWKGTKSPVSQPRCTTGALGRGAVRLAEATDVLGLSEGVETGLSAMEMFGVPTWATLGVGRLGRIAIPPQVRNLHLFAENDEAGQKAEAAAEIYARQGLTVTIRRPPVRFKDFNDVAQDLAREFPA